MGVGSSSGYVVREGLPELRTEDDKGPAEGMGGAKSERGGEMILRSRKKANLSRVEEVRGRGANFIWSAMKNH